MTLRAGLGKLVGAALAGSLLLIAAPAAAKPCHSHGHGHGNSEISQYLENVPGPCGDQNVGGNGSGHQGNGGGGGGSSGGGGGGPASGLPTSTVQGLEKFGSAGAATASFAHATSPGGSTSKSKAGGSGGSAGANSGGGASGSTSPGVDTSDGSVTGALASLVSGGSGQGIGVLLPVLLAAILMGGLGIVALRRGYTQ